MSFFDGGFGAIVGGVLGTAGDLIGGHQDRKFARAQSEADRAFQREVFQNQLQWKAADAKKAGLHPLAALGGGAYSASPSSVSVPGSGLGDSLGKLGEGIGDAFAAYKNKDQLAEEAAWNDEQKRMKREEHDANMRVASSQVLMNNGYALEATRRAQSYTIPMLSGREYMPGQVDSPSPMLQQVDSPSPMLQKFVKPDGTLTGWKPGSEYQEVHSDIPILEFKPHVEAMYWNLRDMFKRQPSRSPNYYYPRSYR